MRWYRSLYWRIAFAVVAFLAAMLVVQAMLFVWAVSQSGRSLTGQSPGRFGMTIALDLANLLERDANADLAQYVREQYSQYEHPFFVMLADGRLITSGSRSFPEPLLRMARARLERGDVYRSLMRESPLRPDGTPRQDGTMRTDGTPRQDGSLRPEEPRRESRAEGLPPDTGRLPRNGPAGLRFGGAGLDRGPSPIVVNGRLAGVVVVPPQAPFGFLLARYARMLTLVAVGVLGVGTVLTAAMIVPARRRLRALETAARQLGAGDLSARAPDRGGDEIAAVASAFNAMAGDLKARADALAASDRTRRQLLADVSHELNTPVTAMRGYLETLTMPELTLDAATRARYLGIIGDETARLERLIGDLLELARLEGGGGALRIEPVAVNQLFNRVTARHERACAEADVRLKTSIEPGAETIFGDRARLEQALQNLAANAIRYAPAGSTVRLDARAAVREVVLAIEDEGPGIAAEHLPHIFDRFYKADTSRHFRSSESSPGDGDEEEPAGGFSGGSGLGLSIVKAIVERHGGLITVQSRPGHTAFEVRLPVTVHRG